MESDTDLMIRIAQTIEVVTECSQANYIQSLHKQGHKQCTNY